MPVVTLEFFHNKTREQINPLVSEDRMKMCVSALHDMGEVRERAIEIEIEKAPWMEGRGREGGRWSGRERAIAGWGWEYTVHHIPEVLLDK